MKIDTLQHWDYRFSTLCLEHKFNVPVARISRWISRSGDGHLYVLIGLLIWLWDQRQGGAFLSTGLKAFALELPVYWVLKNSIRRRRPESLPAFIVPSDRYSLPSGHTAAAFLMAGLISQFFPSLAPLVFAWAVLIGLSRVLLGVHFITDVLVGALLGTGCIQWAQLLII